MAFLSWNYLCPIYGTLHVVYWSQIRKDVAAMYAAYQVRDHVEVYDREGCFLFSADTLQEARSILTEEYDGEL